MTACDLAVVRFLWRVVQLLPWSTEDALADRCNTPCYTRHGLLTIDHRELRRRPQNAQAACWMEFVWTVYDGILEAYELGEVNWECAHQAIYRCASTCARLQADVPIFAAQMQRQGITAKPRQPGRAGFPSWVRKVAQAVMHVLALENPDQLDALSVRHRTSPIFCAAAAWLVTLGVCDARVPSQKTLYGWFLDDPRTAALSRRRPGRPRRAL